MSTGSPKGRRARNGAGAHTKTDVEAPKPRPNISGPTLTSTTRNDPDITITTNPLGSTRFSNVPARQNEPASQPRVALKPTPPKPEKSAVEKEEAAAKYPPPKLRNREWPPKGDKKASLNRVSSPPTVGPEKPLKPMKPRRPESHAGILDKPAVPPPPGKKPQTQWSANAPKKDTDGPKAPSGQPKVPSKPPIRFPKQPTEERPTSLPLKPSDIKKAGLAAGNKKPSSFSTADNKPKKVPLRPPGPIPPRPGSRPT